MTFILIILAGPLWGGPNGDSYTFENRAACEYFREGMTTVFEDYREGLRAKARAFCFPLTQPEDA